MPLPPLPLHLLRLGSGLLAPKDLTLFSTPLAVLILPSSATSSLPLVSMFTVYLTNFIAPHEHSLASSTSFPAITPIPCDEVTLSQPLLITLHQAFGNEVSSIIFFIFFTRPHQISNVYYTVNLWGVYEILPT